ncbi:MAG: hypothetical protein CVV12_05350 [Gammaproteobacteria bacterium HGW-Gammaproteobacteria-2]|jgi:hypothetical protein|nr:MAG: hypothetical protein CVV12_05350 [Gammaproteobacteria bacterium HGW-Gammaproteobacteria-2]
MKHLSALALCATALSIALAAPHAARAADADELSQGLIRLRAEVEALNGELTLLRDEQRTALGTLNAQKAELQANLERQQLAARELREKLATAQEEQVDAGLIADNLKPLLLDALANLRQYIATGLPFKRDERLGELDSFRTQVDSGSLPVPRAVNRLWAFYEDEFRITRENGLHSQTIALGDERVLAEVAKIGSMALYFRTQDGRVGLAQLGTDGWQFVPVSERDDIARINTLYDALKKQIRQGWFELPVANAGGAK